MDFNDLESIGPNNLFSVSTCDLNAKFCDRCYADWSKTNLISIVTLEGIYILKPNLEKINGPFEIELIRNPTIRFKHAPFEKNNISLDEVLNTLDNVRYMGAYLDPALVTTINKSSIETYPRRYRLAKWSPVIDTYPRQCILAVLTIDYQLIIFKHKDGVWAFDLNLSERYDEVWAQTVLASSINDTSFDGIRSNVHALSFSSLCWRYDKCDQQFLLAVTLSGDIALWQLCLSSKNGNKYQRDIVDFSLRSILRTNQKYVNSMQLCEDLLIITSRSGQVCLYDLGQVFHDLATHEYRASIRGSTHIGSTLIIDIAVSAILWHQDNIEVTDFYLQQLSTHDFRIVLAKATNICWCTIHYKPKTDTEPSTLAVSDSFSAIDGLDPEVSLHQTPASWLRPAGERRAVLIADDGSFFLLEFLDDHQDTSPTFNAIRTGKIDLTDMMPRGLCCSPNGYLISMISSVAFLVDPLKIPAPTKLILLPTQNEKTHFISCLRNMLDENWLNAKNIRSPMDVRDAIDFILSMFPALNTNQYFQFHMLLKDEISQLGKPETHTQFVKMKIISFILLKLLKLDSYKKGNGTHEELEKSIYDILLLDNIELILGLTLNQDHADCGDLIVPLTADQVNSLRNCMSWLDKSLQGQQIRDKYKKKFDEMISSKYKQVPYEICSICQCDIPFESYKYGTCTNKHQFVRCSRSLLVLDLSKRDRLQCTDCQRSYMAELIWPSNNLWLCFYCQ